LGRDFGDTLMANLPGIIGNTIGNLVADRVGGRGRGGAPGAGDGASAQLTLGLGGGQVGDFDGITVMARPSSNIGETDYFPQITAALGGYAKRKTESGWGAGAPIADGGWSSSWSEYANRALNIATLRAAGTASERVWIGTHQSQIDLSFSADFDQLYDHQLSFSSLVRTLLDAPYLSSSSTRSPQLFSPDLPIGDGGPVLNFLYDSVVTAGAVTVGRAIWSAAELGLSAITMRGAADSAGSRVTTLIERVETPNPLTGEGYGVNNPPVRISGEWTDSDVYNALYGRSPQSLGRPQLHHADQMPGSAIHEVLAGDHLGNAALHPNKWNQGVTGAMRTQDTKLHWWYRAQEQGASSIYPNHIYD